MKITNKKSIITKKKPNLNKHTKIMYICLFADNYKYKHTKYLVQTYVHEYIHINMYVYIHKNHTMTLRINKRI